MTLPFSSNDEEVIHRKIGMDEINQYHSNYCIAEYFEISRCSDWIRSRNFCKVVLQFPDSLLTHSAEVSVALQKNTNCEVFVLGDTSYGSCCVDEIAAEHVEADCVIHFGHSCLSPTNRLPVLYVFGKYPIDLDCVVKEFSSLFKDEESLVIVLYEVFYAHALSELSMKLKSLYKNIIFAQHQIPSENDHPSDKDEPEMTRVNKCGRTFYIPNANSLDSCSMFYIGSTNQSLVNLMLTFSKCPFFTYSPATGIARRETLCVNKHLRKRYYFIERAKDSKIVGILVGTLGVSNYLNIINHLQTIIKAAGKKAYLISVGKLNSAKLANFPAIDIFVYVACAECSIVDAHEFYQPIVTPFEMEIACNQARGWTGDYVTDFSELLPGAAHHIPLSAATEALSDVSLITGKLRSLGRTDETTEESSSNSNISVRDKMVVASLHSDAAGEYLANQSWQGLDQKLGQTPVPVLSQGIKGIASGYEGEGQD